MSAAHAYDERPAEPKPNPADELYSIWCDSCGLRIEGDEDYGETDHTGQIFCTACWARLAIDEEED